MPYTDSLQAATAQARKIQTVRNLTTVPFNTAVELQQLIVKTCNSPECTPAALAQLARAWDVLEDRKRVIKMKPAPKPVDVTDLARSKQRKPAARGFTETPQDKPAKPESKSNESGPAPS